MHSIHSISGYRADQQTSKSTATKPTVVNIEDDISLSIPNTTDVGNSATAQGSDVQSDDVEGIQSKTNANDVELEPLHSQHSDSPRSPQVKVNKEDKTLQQVLGNVYQNKITEFKGKLKQCLSSTALLEEENKTFRKELLEWIDRWKKVNIKKNQYKKSKKSILSTN